MLESKLGSTQQVLHHRATPSASRPSLLFDITARNLRQQEGCFHFSRVSKMNIRFLASHWFGGWGHWGTGSLIQVFLSCLLTPIPDEPGYQILLKAMCGTPYLRPSRRFLIECGIPQPLSSKVHFISRPRGMQKKPSALWSIRTHTAFWAGSVVKQRPGQQLCKLPWPAERARVSRPRKAWNRLGHSVITSPSAKRPHLLSQLFLSLSQVRVGKKRALWSRTII